MYAVIEVGGKQYTVRKGDSIDVEKQDAKKGAVIVLEKVLLLSDDLDVVIGQPYIKDATVKATVAKHLLGKKVISYKYRRRKSSDWKKGHRQKLTTLAINEIAAK